VDRFARWPVFRQWKARDLDGLGPRTRDADAVKRSVCPYGAVGCGFTELAADGSTACG
jgi:formate dehydrogenase major subunit